MGTEGLKGQVHVRERAGAGKGGGFMGGDQAHPREEGAGRAAQRCRLAGQTPKGCLRAAWQGSSKRVRAGPRMVWFVQDPHTMQTRTIHSAGRCVLES